MKFNDAEKYRKPHPLGFPHGKGDDFGWFEVPTKSGRLFVMVAPSDEEWQHVSVSKKERTPTWEEMSFIKNLFFDDEDICVSFFPAKSQYVNLAKNCLHIWRNTRIPFPTPPTYLIGPLSKSDIKNIDIDGD